MKKKYYLFFVIPFVISCENTNSPNQYQIEIDSTVSVKLAEYQAKVAVKNDSILNALENAKADSLVKNDKNTVANKSKIPSNLDAIKNKTQGKIKDTLTH